jgi:uncharacterized protein (TIGR02145 family)
MNKIIFLLLCILIFNTLGFSQQVKDIDGNTYKTIKIKDQLWFESNLKTTRYANGDKILKTKKESKWVNQDSLPKCVQHNIKKDKSIYYNWYVINDKRGVCPSGWKVPSQKEFSELISALGGTEKAGLKMKNLIAWGDTTKHNETNLFNAIPTGFVEITGKLNQENARACWWTKDEQHVETAYSYSIGNMGAHIIRDKFYKKQGNTVRCMKSLRED